MKISNFRGDSTDISAEKEALMVVPWSELVNNMSEQQCCPPVTAAKLQPTARPISNVREIYSVRCMIENSQIGKWT